MEKQPCVICPYGSKNLPVNVFILYVNRVFITIHSLIRFAPNIRSVIFPLLLPVSGN